MNGVRKLQKRDEVGFRGYICNLKEVKKMYIVTYKFID